MRHEAESSLAHTQGLTPQNETAKRSIPIHSFLKYLAIFTSVFLTAVIQTGFFLNFRPLGASPDLCLALCVATSLKWGAKKGAIVGIMAGVCVDAFSSIGISLLIPFYFILSIIIGLFAEGKNTQGFTYFISAISISAALRVLLTFFMMCLTSPSFSASETFFHTILPHFIITVVASPIIHLVVLAVDKLFGKKDRTTRR